MALWHDHRAKRLFLIPSRYFCEFFLFFFLLSCSPSEDQETLPNQDSLFTKLDPDQTGIDFINEVEDGELFNVLTYRNFYNGGGVAIGATHPCAPG